MINWAYDPPLHLQPVYKRILGNSNSYKETENLMKRHFHLPLHMQLTKRDAQHIVKTLIVAAKNFF